MIYCLPTTLTHTSPTYSCITLHNEVLVNKDVPPCHRPNNKAKPPCITLLLFNIYFILSQPFLRGILEEIRLRNNATNSNSQSLKSCRNLTSHLFRSSSVYLTHEDSTYLFLFIENYTREDDILKG